MVTGQDFINFILNMVQVFMMTGRIFVMAGRDFIMTDGDFQNNV